MARRTTRLGVILAIALLAVAALPAAAATQPPQTRRVTILAVNRVPILDINVTGTLSLTLTGTSDSFGVGWSFRGLTVGGGPASASGGGVGSWTDNTLTVTLTSINNWNIPGFEQPQLPQTGTVDQVNARIASASVSNPEQGTIVGGIPLFVLPRMQDPFAGRKTSPFYTESSLGTGSTNIQTLPGATMAAAGR